MDFDVDTLLDRMKQRGAKVSRATLYNTIELFLEAGLVRKHRRGAKPIRARLPAPSDHIILDSEEVLEFCDPRIQQIGDLEDHFGIEILHRLAIRPKKN